MNTNTLRLHDKKMRLKGNVHLHSTASDGGLTFPEIAALYARESFDFLFRTDHWVCSDADSDTGDYPLLWIDGIELDGHDKDDHYYHIICLGKVENIDRDKGLIAAVNSAKAQGALVILAHPQWCGNTLQDVRSFPFDGVEVYNHVCHWLNGKSNGLAYWEALLAQNRSALALAVDDAHLRPEHPGWNGGWIVVNSDDKTADSILTSIREGNFYASCGPDIESVGLEDGKLHIRTSPVQFIRIVGKGTQGDRRGGFDGSLITQADFPIPENWDHLYIEIEDEQGRRAWSNNLL